MGDLIPTPLGEQLLPVVTGVSRALIEKSREERAQRQSGGTTTLDVNFADPRSSACADIMEATTHATSLELELRGPDGRVIPTESIGVQDTEFLLSLARDAESPELEDGWDPELDAELSSMMVEDDEQDEELALDEPAELWRDYGDERIEEGTWPRYQIQVQLIDDDNVP